MDSHSQSALDGDPLDSRKRPYEASSSESVVSFATDSVSITQGSVSVANSVVGPDGRRPVNSSAFTTGSRQRITVVCAECKRLKLKCDRRVPCGSCTKRGTIPRCIYSQAASEKVDVQSLNIRLSTVERKLNAVSSDPTASTSTAGQPSSSNGRNRSTAAATAHPRAFHAVSAHGASVAVNLEGVAGLWVDHLGLNTSATRAVPANDFEAELAGAGGTASGSGIELRPFPAIPDEGVVDFMTEHTKLFRIPASLVASTSDAGEDAGASDGDGDGFNDHDAEGDDEREEASGQIGVSRKLVRTALPAAHVRQEIYPRFEAAHLIAPCVNFFVFRNRIEEMCRWADGELSGSETGNENGSRRKNEPPPATSATAPSGPFTPTLSFFAAAAMGLALGAQCWLAERGILTGNAGSSSSDAPAAAAGVPSPSGPSTAVPGPSAFDKSMPPPPGPGPSFDNGISASPTSPPTGPSSSSIPGFSSFQPQQKLQEAQIDASLPGMLYRLSKLALGLALERAGYEAFDTDYIHAKCLQARYLLLSHHGLGDGANLLGGLGAGRRRRMTKKGKGKGKGKAGAKDGEGERGGDTVMDDAYEEPAGQPSRSTSDKDKTPARGPTLALAPEMVGAVSDAVGNARMMGLNHDPDIGGGGRFSLYEKEVRRRLWWEVVTLDAFVADCLGESPFINDDSATTEFPTDVDEENFGPDSANLPAPHTESLQGNIDYFIQRCRLVDLGKRLKRKAAAFRELHSDVHPSETHDMLETMNGEISGWLTNLPDHLKLKDLPSLAASSMLPDVKPMSPSSKKLSALGSPADRDNPIEDVSPHLVSMRCSLAISARHLFVKLCLPFTKGSGGREVNPKTETGMRPGMDDLAPSSRSFEALVMLNPAMYVVQAWKHLHAVMRHVRPSLFMCFAFTKELFDAAVVLGHLAIEQPLLAAKALVGMRAASDVIRDPTVLTGRPSVGERGSLPSEAVRIIEELILKAEAAYVRETGMIMDTGTPVKRKNEEVEADSSDFLYHFRLPFVGAGVVSAGPPVQTNVNAVVTPAGSPLTDAGSVGSSRSRSKHSAAARDGSGTGTAAGDPRPATTKLKSSHPGLSVRKKKGKESSRARANSSASARSDGSHMLPPANPPRSSGPPGPSASSSHSLPHHNLTHNLTHNHNVPPHQMASVEPATPLLGPSSYPGPLSSTPGPGPGPPHYASPPVPGSSGSSQGQASDYPAASYHDAGFPAPSPSSYGPPFPPQLPVPSQAGFESFGVGSSGQGQGQGQGRMTIGGGGGGEHSPYGFGSTNGMERPVGMHQSAGYDPMGSLPRPPSEPPQDRQFARTAVESRTPGPSNQMAPPMQSLEQQPQAHPHPPQIYHPHLHPHPHPHSHAESQSQVQVQAQPAEPMVAPQGWSQNASEYPSWNPYYQ